MDAKSVYTYSWAGEHLLHKAASDGDTDSLQQLLEDGHDPMARGGPTCWLRGASDPHSRTPLHYAAKHGHLLCVRLLLKHGADPNSKDDDGYTPLHYLCQVYNPGPERHDNLRLCVESLIRCGGDVGARTNGGRCPLDIARIQKNRVCEKALWQQCMSHDTMVKFTCPCIYSRVNVKQLLECVVSK